MAGQVRPWKIDTKELDVLSEKDNKQERVTPLKVPFIPSPDLAKQAQEIPASPPAPKAEIPAERPVETKPEEVPEDVFSSKASTLVDLDKALIEKYGVEWMEWTSETVLQTVHSDFGTRIAAINKDKIEAAKTLHVTDAFWKTWEVFEKIVMAANNHVPLFDRVQQPSLGEIAFCLVQVNDIRKEPFSDEVLYYIAARAKDAGMIYLAQPLDMAQKHLDELNPSEIVPLKTEIRDRWDAFRGAAFDEVEFKEDVYGIHLAKLAAIQRYIDGLMEE